jgi:hypothetical protein
MKDKVNTPQSFIKMEEARKMMDRGQYQESLVLALDALLQELENLRSSLLALQTATRSELPAASASAREDQPHLEPYWLPPVKPRVLH